MRRRPRPSICVFLLLLTLTLLSCLGYYRLASSSTGYVFHSPFQSAGGASSSLKGAEEDTKMSASSPESPSQSLASTLAKQKKALLERLSRPEENESEPFVIIMGNEAGDTDSLASSVMLCNLLSSPLSREGDKGGSLASQFPQGTTFVPLQQLPRADLALRAENEMLLSLLKISASDLLYWDDLPSPMQPRKDVILGLTDHPQLSALWHPYEDWRKKVEIVVDHHADDGAHAEAKIRILRGPNKGAIGSDVSVVVDLFKDSPALQKLPKGIVDLALAALLIDTADLRPTPEGKATPTDLAAGEILLKLSSFSGASSKDFISTAVQLGGQVAADAVKLEPESTEEMSIETASIDSKAIDRASAYFRVLSALKLDVSRLNTLDLLRRDYKESDVTLSQGTGGAGAGGEIRAGFSSVPVGISDWVHGRHGEGAERWDGYWKALQDWMKTKKLDVAVVGTSFRDGSEDGEKGKHKRELLLAYKDKTASTSSLFPSLVKYLETEAYSTEMGGDVSLLLGLDSPWKGWRRVAGTGKKERVGSLDKEGRWSGDADLRVAVWLQRNGQASRKVYLPAVVHALKKAAKGKA